MNNNLKPCKRCGVLPKLIIERYAYSSYEGEIGFYQCPTCGERAAGEWYWGEKSLPEIAQHWNEKHEVHDDA